MAKSKNLFIKIDTGVRIGRLTVGELVRWVQQHELYPETPISYLQQGRLRECTCDCGQRRLLAESVLATGRLQSCGCLRREIRAHAASWKLRKMEIAAERKSVSEQIKIEQQRLRVLKMTDSIFRDETQVMACGERIRALIARKGMLTREFQKVNHS